MEIAGKVVLVTGASSGIGAATARLAAEAGARLVLAARRTDRIEALAKELPDAVAVTTDVTDPDQVRRAVRAGLDAYGRIDVLVNNAGQGLHLPLEQVAADDFRAIIELNVVAPLVVMQAVIPVMRAEGGGSIVNVSSGTTRGVLPGVGAYAATKAGLNMLSAVARQELADDGIVVSTVYPFITATEFHDVLRAGRLANGSGRPPAQSAEEVAAAILGLLRSGDEEAVLVLPGFGR
ncbi:SDR family NAD(P)-dependent oxidoreductase [Planosporangium thailandense]|uniref:SDR family NAD(P)-dependent oxidoreductase n=2 Tax=Planosporangium thailandense TaxID=765197 RepID=A0ABX0Y084_9ACTN|nr:SDR family NAD(P)-dependent oxidoreductase [Planosporangium thailandense]NJC70872.1 SDR family NAD(P)-dependent oxidoreductase [Planosporangium thailandense]